MQNRFNFKENTKIPRETRNLLGQQPQIDNFALRLNLGSQFIRNNDGAYKATLYKRERVSKLNPTEYEVHYIPSAQEWRAIDFPELAKKLFQNVELLFAKDRSSFFSSNLKQSENSRLVIGMGNASVFETGITLHHVFGFPFIPASSIKGIVRSWVIQNCFKEQEEEAIADKSFCDLFGCPSQLIIDDENGDLIKKAYIENGKEVLRYPKSYYQINNLDKLGGERCGSLLFFDAFPIHSPNVKEDIMNPHYPEYYTGVEPPADSQSPIPINFLTVEKTTFQFLLGLKPLPGLENAKVSGLISEHLGAENSELNLLEAGTRCLLKALTEHGIGAKTAVGYGYFNESESN